jgi:hypothetical protein
VTKAQIYAAARAALAIGVDVRFKHIAYTDQYDVWIADVHAGQLDPDQFMALHEYRVDLLRSCAVKLMTAARLRRLEPHEVALVDHARGTSLARSVKS